MKLIHAVLALLLIVAASILAVFLIDQPEAATGLAHDTFAGMRVGGDGAARFVASGPIALVMFSAMFVLFAVLLYMGISPHRRSREVRIWITAGTGAFLLVWWGMYGTYSAYLESGEFSMLLGFPLPTAFMVFGLWLAGIIYVIGYVVGFRRFVFTQEDEEAYEELLRRFGQREGDD